MGLRDRSVLLPVSVVMNLGTKPSVGKVNECKAVGLESIASSELKAMEKELCWLPFWL